MLSLKNRWMCLKSFSKGHRICKTSSTHPVYVLLLMTYCHMMGSCNTAEWIKQFSEVESTNQPTFEIVQQYMNMIESLLPFIWSVRTTNWNLHFAALEDFEIFFANYSAMVAWGFAEIRGLEKSDPDNGEEFWKGNWVVKRSLAPFCVLGSGEAIKYGNVENRH